MNIFRELDIDVILRNQLSEVGSSDLCLLGIRVIVELQLLGLHCCFEILLDSHCHLSHKRLVVIQFLKVNIEVEVVLRDVEGQPCLGLLGYFII